MNPWTVLAACIVVLASSGCGSQEPTPPADVSSPSGEVTGQAPSRQEPERRHSAGGEATSQVGSDESAANVVDPEDAGPARLPDAEIDARMLRPIEESVYDPTLTKSEKLDLLLRHYHGQRRFDGPPDELMHHVMSEGMSNLATAKYWAGDGGSHRWAVFHAEAALRSDPQSVEALAMWARLLHRDGKLESQAAYMAVLERDPTHRRALARLASATAMDRPHESMEYARRLIDIHPKSGRGYLFMGQGYERLGDPEAAAAQYEAGLKVAPDDGALRGSLAFLNSGRSTIEPIDAARTGPEPVETSGSPAHPPPTTKAPAPTPPGASSLPTTAPSPQPRRESRRSR